MKNLELNKFYNMDCIEGMKKISDKFFEIAIVDPPYGLNFGNYSRGVKKEKIIKGSWDEGIPDKKYFKELFRVSKNQIIWGGNYFDLPPCKGFIFWYKHQPVTNFADGEFAWTSFNQLAKCFDYPFFGAVNREDDKFHPTQKPIKLYKWILQNYAQKGDKILDTHVGSASSLIACAEMDFDYMGFEINKKYYKEANKRLEESKRQFKMFF